MELTKRDSFDIQRAVVFALVLREVRGRFGVNRLGAFWFVFEPLCHVAIMITLYTVVRQRTIPGVDVPMFLVTGIVPFLFFKNLITKGMDAVNANQGLFVYRQIKPFDCVVARAIVEFSMMACVYVALIFVLAFWGHSSASIEYPLDWIYTLAVGVTLSFGLSLIFCVIIDILPEARAVIRLALMPLYLFSGIIFPIWRLPPQYLEYLTWNPYFHIVDMLRRAVLPNYPHVSAVDETYPVVFAFVALFAGLALYRARRLKLVAR